MPIEHIGARNAQKLRSLADDIASAKRIVVVTGAGISTSCGIPDFRSKDGLYALTGESLNDGPRRSGTTPIKGKDLFDSSVWRSEQGASTFYKFMAGMKRTVTQDVREPSRTHRFLKTLHDARKLVRVYTQNIDGLEQRTGLNSQLEAGAGDRRRFTRKALETPIDQVGLLPNSGCDVVQLHGDLDTLRCTYCKHTSSWTADISSRSSSMPADEPHPSATFSEGGAPSCPDCATMDLARRLRGQRGTKVGTLRPNIVLYGEEHPSADKIGPIVQHDVGLAPDMLLIMGTSLKVHGLKRLVREFAGAVHHHNLQAKSKNGKNDRPKRVIFVNQTAPAESSWKDIIDDWVEMDCDKFVDQVKRSRGDLWEMQTGIRWKAAKTGETVQNGLKRKRAELDLCPKAKKVKGETFVFEDRSATTDSSALPNVTQEGGSMEIYEEQENLDANATTVDAKDGVKARTQRVGQRLKTRRPLSEKGSPSKQAPAAQAIGPRKLAGALCRGSNGRRGAKRENVPV